MDDYPCPYCDCDKTRNTFISEHPMSIMCYYVCDLCGAHFMIVCAASGRMFTFK